MDVNSLVGLPERKIIKDAVPYATVFAEATNLLPPPQQPGLPDPNPGPQLPIDEEVRFSYWIPIGGHVKGCIHNVQEENQSMNKLMEEKSKVCCVSNIVTGRITLDMDEQDKAKEKAIFTLGNINDLFPIGGFLTKEPGDEDDRRRKKGDGHAVGSTTFDNDNDEKSGNIKEEEQGVCCVKKITTILEDDDSKSGNKEKEG